MQSLEEFYYTYLIAVSMSFHLNTVVNQTKKYHSVIQFRNFEEKTHFNVTAYTIWLSKWPKGCKSNFEIEALLRKLKQKSFVICLEVNKWGSLFLFVL